MIKILSIKDFAKKNNLIECEVIPLIEFASGESYSKILVNNGISEKAFSKFKKYVSMRKKHIPMQKIMGGTEFLGVNTRFSKNVLTPRQETEKITQDLIDEINSINKKEIYVLDLCSGSGCIGLAVKKNTRAKVTCLDISPKAIKEITYNSKKNKLDIEIVKGDMFDKICTKYDFIISNPPYIASKELPSLELEVKKYDPKLALDGGDDGLKFYKLIASNSWKYLSKNGKIYLEIAFNQAKDIENLLQDKFKNIKIEKDFAGFDRKITAEVKDN